jgi:hypothetical protein
MELKGARNKNWAWWYVELGEMWFIIVRRECAGFVCDIFDGSLFKKN